MDRVALERFGLFIAGVLAMAGLLYLFWRSAGQPPPEP